MTQVISPEFEAVSSGAQGANSTQTLEKRDASTAAAGDAWLQSILDNFPGGVCVYDAELTLVLYNESVRRLLDFPKALLEPTRPTMEDLFRFNAQRGEYGQGDVDGLVAERMARVRLRAPHAYERERPNGVILEIRGAPLPGGGFITTYQDVTEARLRTRHLEAVLENYPGGLCLYDADNRMILCNDALKTLLEFPDALFEGGLPSMEAVFWHNAERGEYGPGDPEGQVRARLDRAKLREPHEYERQRPNGRWLGIRGVPVEGGGFLTTYHDVTDKHRSQELIAHLAHHDGLTDLPNRILLADRLRQATAQAARGFGFALLCLDLDRFKPVNDTYGHAAGDALLKEVAARLRGATRDTDTVARVGGDEFVVLQAGAPNRAGVDAVARRLIEWLSRPFELEEATVTIGASIGVAMAPDHGVDPDRLLSRADQALYDAKASGRGNYRVWGEGEGEEVGAAAAGGDVAAERGEEDARSA